METGHATAARLDVEGSQRKAMSLDPGKHEVKQRRASSNPPASVQVFTDCLVVYHRVFHDDIQLLIFRYFFRCITAYRFRMRTFIATTSGWTLRIRGICEWDLRNNCVERLFSSAL